MPPVANSVGSYVENLIKENKIVIFSKTTCPWCAKVKQLFTDLNEKFTTVEIDVVENGDEIKSYLASKTNQATVPNVFVRGNHIGGHDDTVKAQKQGSLAKMLSELEDGVSASKKRKGDESIEAYVDRLVKSDRVFIFTTSTCPWCKKLRALLDGINEQYSFIELDLADDGAAVRKHLADITKQTSVPNIFINGNHFGGYDSTSKAHSEGRLSKLIHPETATDSSSLKPKPGESIQSFVSELVQNNKIVIFSKSTCPFCTKVKELFKSLNEEYIALELDQIDDGPAIRDYLFEKTGQKTVPNVYVRNTHLGGCDNTLTAHAEGRLPKLLVPQVPEAVEEAYDYDLVVIGGGSGGLACSKEAASYGIKVAVLDFVKPTPIGTTWGLGGTCVNVGCIPKKLMHQSALLGEGLHDSKEFGWQTPDGIQHNWQTMRENIQNYIGSLNWNYKVQLRDKKVEYINASGKFVDNHKLLLTYKNGKTKEITSKNIVVAVGGRPKYPDNLTGAIEHCITSDDLFSLSYNPGKTLCVGASYVSLECAGFLKGIGLDVTVMVRSILLRGFDQQMANSIGDFMEKGGIKFLRGSVPVEIVKIKDGEPGELLVKYKNEENEIKEEVFNTVLLAVGREPCTTELEVEKLGVKINPKNLKILTTFEQSSVDNIYAVGDVIDESSANGRVLELTPVAVKAGQLLARRLYGGSDVKMDYYAVPTTVFTPLEYGAIGYSEEEAIESFGEDNIEVYHTNYWPLEWTVAHKPHDVCYAKLICNKLDKERVVGFHVAGPNSGEITQGYAVAIKMRATKKDFDMTVGIHPTCSETFTTLTVTKNSGKSAAGSGC